MENYTNSIPNSTDGPGSQIFKSKLVRLGINELKVNAELKSHFKSL